MSALFSYQDRTLFCHHLIDQVPNQADFPMHTHEGLQIAYFLQGDACYLVEGTVYPLSPGDLLILRSGETHHLRFDSPVPYERVALHFPAELFDSIDIQHRLLTPFFDRPAGQQNLYAAADYPDAAWHAALRALDPPQSSYPRMQLTACILSVLTELCDAFYARYKKPAAAAQTFSAQLVTYVNTHLFEPISVSSIAAAFSRSPSQINRIFRDASGSSLWEYVRLKRLLAAQSLLQRGKSAAYVCSICGYNDYSSFYRAYKAHFGCAPSKVPKTD